MDEHKGESEMRFVKKKGSSPSFKSFVHAVESPTEIRDLFKKWCESKGGEYESKPTRQSCVFESEFGYLDEAVVRDFYDFIRQHKPLLDKLEGWANTLAISSENKLIGGYREGVDVEYIPPERRFYITALFYSDYGEPTGEPVYEKIPLKKKVEGVLPWSAELEVEDNEATWEWMGVADVWASMPFHEASPDKLAKAAEEAAEIASDFANEAREELLKPVEEEEAW